MKLSDMPTPISDAAESDDYYCSGMVDVDVSRDLEKRLAIAVAALKESERLTWGFPAMDAIVCIQKALAQIEEK